jgi:hypothetical protein
VKAGALIGSFLRRRHEAEGALVVPRLQHQRAAGTAFARVVEMDVVADETAALQRAADRDLDGARALAADAKLATDAGGALAHERVPVAPEALEARRMGDLIATEADSQRRRDDGRAVELLELAPLAFSRDIARTALDRDGFDASRRVGSELRVTEHAGMAARLSRRQCVGKRAPKRCRRWRRRRDNDQSRHDARRRNGAHSLCQEA